MSHLKIGMRMVKTSLAVTISYIIYIPILLHTELPIYSNGPFYACAAAAICMQSSVGASVKQGIARLVGTFIGGAIALLSLLILDQLGNHEVLIAALLGVGVIIVLWCCNALKMPSACTVSVIVLCVVFLKYSGPERYLFALARIIETAVGVLVALAVNLILPVKSKDLQNISEKQHGSDVEDLPGRKEQNRPYITR